MLVAPVDDIPGVFQEIEYKKLLLIRKSCKTRRRAYIPVLQYIYISSTSSVMSRRTSPFIGITTQIMFVIFRQKNTRRIDYILTRQRDRKFVQNVTVHPQPSFLPISDHNIVSALVKLLGHFAPNRRLRASAKKPPVDRRRLVTDPQLRQEVATAVGRHLRANPPGDSSVDDVAAAFAAAIMRTAELVIPPQERRIPGRGWSGDARTESELQAATDAMHSMAAPKNGHEGCAAAEGRQEGM